MTIALPFAFLRSTLPCRVLRPPPSAWSTRSATRTTAHPVFGRARLPRASFSGTVADGFSSCTGGCRSVAGARREFSSRREDDNDGSGSASERKTTKSKAPTSSDSSQQGKSDGVEDHTDEEPATVTAVYVHPLSRLVLLFFQADEGYDWMASRGLVANHSLRINADGSVALAFPSTGSSPSPPLAEEDNEEVWTSDRVADQVSAATLSSSVDPGDVPSTDAPIIPNAADPASDDNHQEQHSSSGPQRDEIWTQYDAGEMRHWLCCAVQGKEARFLLQDCAEAAKEARRRRLGDDDEHESLWRHTPWKIGIHGNPRRTLADRVDDAVRAVMQEIDQAILTDSLAAP